MKRFFLILTILFIGCKKEKTFADDIVLSFTKDEKLTIQEFNEDGNEAGTNLFYKGYDSGKVEIKYFKNIMPEPPPPPGINEKKLSDRINTFRDSLKNVQSPYLKNEEIEIFETKEDLYESLSNKNLAVTVKEKDTIPLYKRDYGTDKIKKHKAFPVFIKNISTKTLRIPIDGPAVALYVSNNSQFQFIRNSNYTIMNCLELPESPYFELKPNEILIYSFPHLKKGTKRKSKIVFFKASSKEFNISINEHIVKNQRSTHYLQ